MKKKNMKSGKLKKIKGYSIGGPISSFKGWTDEEIALWNDGDEITKFEIENRVKARLALAEKTDLSNPTLNTLGKTADAASLIGAASSKSSTEEPKVEKNNSGLTNKQVSGLGLATDFLANSIQPLQGTRTQNVLSGAGKGAEIGTAIAPGIGTAIGAGAGALIGAALKSEKEKLREEKKKKESELLNQINQSIGKDKWATAEAMTTGNDLITPGGVYALATDKAKKAVQDQINKEYKARGLASGGKIEGPGTSKSDSIPAKLENNGFVVPAENAKIAEELRKMFLGENKKAPLKSGNTKVKVSDGEHYFTPEEVKILTENGVDLDQLAPDADNKLLQGLSNGGEINVEQLLNKGGKIDKEAHWKRIEKVARDSGITDSDTLKVIRAIVEHETIGFKKLKEVGPSKSKIKDDEKDYYGRGYIQLTHKNNYKKATEYLKSIGIDIDLVANPEKAADPDIAAIIAIQGMKEGWFTGKKLSELKDKDVGEIYKAIVNPGAEKEKINQVKERYKLISKDNNKINSESKPIISEDNLSNKTATKPRNYNDLTKEYYEILNPNSNKNTSANSSYGYYGPEYYYSGYPKRMKQKASEKKIYLTEDEINNLKREIENAKNRIKENRMLNPSLLASDELQDQIGIGRQKAKELRERDAKDRVIISNASKLLQKAVYNEAKPNEIIKTNDKKESTTDKNYESAFDPVDEEKPDKSVLDKPLPLPIKDGILSNNPTVLEYAEIAKREKELQERLDKQLEEIPPIQTNAPKEEKVSPKLTSILGDTPAVLAALQLSAGLTQPSSLPPDYPIPVETMIRQQQALNDEKIAKQESMFGLSDRAKSDAESKLQSIYASNAIKTDVSATNSTESILGKQVASKSQMDAITELALKDEMMRMQKKEFVLPQSQRADTLSQSLDQFKLGGFQRDFRLWQTREAAKGKLIGAGLQNLIDYAATKNIEILKNELKNKKTES